MKPFWRSVFSEADGTGSWSRVSSAMTLVASLVWVSYVVLHTKAIPSLDGVALFIGTGNVSYVANKVSTAIAANKGTSSSTTITSSSETKS